MNPDCDLCGSTENHHFMLLPDYQFNGFDFKIKYVQCLNCGLVYRQEVDSGYSREEYPSHYPPYQDTGSEPLSVISKKRLQAIEKYKRAGNILDIGCSSGAFLSLFIDKPGWNLFGVEPGESPSQIAAKKSSRIKVIQGIFDEGLFQHEYFDVITMWDVLEHLSSPSKTLSIIFEILKSGGLLVIRIPNLDSIDFRIFKQFWAGLDAPRHKYVFNRTNIRRILSERGFNIIEMKSNIGYYPNFLKSIEFWLRGKKVNKVAIEIILTILRYPLTRVICSPIFYVIGEGTIGSELVITAEKPS